MTSNLHKEWQLKKTAVYLSIVTEDDCLVCFMSATEFDKDTAEHIVKLHNNSISKDDKPIGL